MTCHAVSARNPGPMTGAGNWTYVLPGPQPLLIDAGVGHAEHIDDLAHLLPDGPARVVVTHAHSDHCAGAPALAARWPSAEFRKMPWPERDPVLPRPWQRLAEGDRITTGEVTLEVLHTPGHAPDHLALWEPESRTMFVGDLVVLGSSVVIPASAGGNLRDYLASLRRILALEPVRLLPAHGPVIEDPAAVVGQYLEHRRQRDAQVLEAVSAGCTTPEAIADRLYPRLDERLRRMALESVRAHLVKLADEGQTVEDDSGWRLGR